MTQYVTDDNVVRYLQAREQDNEKIEFEQGLSEANEKDEQQKAQMVTEQALQRAGVGQQQPTEPQQPEAAQAPKQPAPQQQPGVIPDWQIPDAMGNTATEPPQIEPVMEADGLPSAGTPEKAVNEAVDTEVSTFEHVADTVKYMNENLAGNLTKGTLQGMNNAMNAIVPGFGKTSDDAWRSAGFGDEVDAINKWASGESGPSMASDKAMQNVGQFMGNFNIWMKMAGKLPEVSKWTQAFVASQTTAFMNLDPHVERMSAVAQELGVQNDFVAWLADNKDESEFEGRIKNTIENTFMDSGIWAAFKLAKGAWWAGKAANAEIDKNGLENFIRGPEHMREKGGIMVGSGEPNLLDDWRVNVGLKKAPSHKIYRGVNDEEGGGMASYGQGLYTTTSRKEASQYGNVIEMSESDLPANPLRFDSVNDYQIWETGVMKKLGIDKRELYKKYPDVSNLVREIDPALDGIQIGKGKDSIFVKYPEAAVEEPIKKQPLLKGKDFRRRKDGSYVGLPQGINTPQKVTKMGNELEALAQEGEKGRMWYEDSSKAILKAVGGDKAEAERLAQIIAVTSQSTGVKMNMGQALKAYAQHKAGMPIHTGRFPKEMSKKINAILDGEGWDGRKTNSFYRNLMEEIDPQLNAKLPTTQDMWMARAFGYNQDNPSPAQYQAMEEINTKIADRLGWTPHQTQAAIWVAVKSRMDTVKPSVMKHAKQRKWVVNGKVVPKHQDKFDKYLRQQTMDLDLSEEDLMKGAYNYANAIDDNLGHIALEAIPGRSTGVLPGIHDAPPEQIAEFTDKMYSIFTDADGVDQLAKDIGLVAPDNFTGFGGWAGDVNPSIQLRAAMSGTTDAGINEADRKLLDVYAAVVGSVFRQEGVGYRRAFPTKSAKDSNGVFVGMAEERPLTRDETRSLYDELRVEFGDDWTSPIPSHNGVEIINFGEMDNNTFRKKVTSAVERAKLGDVSVDKFKSDGDLLENNWEVSPNGEDYQARVSEEGSSDLFKRNKDVYEAKATAVREEFSQKYGWGKAAGIAGIAAGIAGAGSQEAEAGSFSQDVVDIIRKRQAAIDDVTGEGAPKPEQMPNDPRTDVDVLSNLPDQIFMEWDQVTPIKEWLWKNYPEMLQSPTDGGA